MKKIEKKLSIIMPVYNADKLLEKTLNSFLNNLNNSVELIIIDDNSTDTSLKMLKDYEKKYDYIKIIHNEKNMGAGLSRNKGLAIARGKYIGFIDSDDYVDENYFQNMLDEAENNDCDIVVSDITLVYKNREEYGTIYKNNVYQNKEREDISISKELLLGNWTCASTCNKIFKNDLIKNLKFSKKNSDDLLFTIPAIIDATKIGYCKNNNYYYVQTEDSVTRNVKYKTYKENLECLFKATKYLYDKSIELAQIYAANCLLSNICYSLDTISLTNLDDYLNIVKEEFDDNDFCNEIINNNKYLYKTNYYSNKKYKDRLDNIKNNDYENIKKYIVHEEELVAKRKKKMTNNNFNPLVTIVIPVYNGENYVKEAIESALNQTYKNIEVIVVNDGSTDKTDEICKSYKDKIIYIKKKNGGVASALNEAIKNMNGDYLSWLSHDDLYFEDKIEKQINYLSHCDNKNTILFSNYIFINENGRKLGEVVIRPKIYNNKPEYLLLRGCINGITLLIPKKAFDDCGSFNTSLRCTQDYDMWYRMIKKYKFVQVEDFLSKTRIHSLQDTVSNPKAISEGEKLWKRMVEDITDERKKELEGSIYNYYYEMALHLMQSPYTETFNMCIEKCKGINLKKYNKHPISLNNTKTIIQKVKYCLKNYGLMNTIKIIFRKLLKR